MRTVLGWLLVVVIGLAAVGGALLLLQSRDDAGVSGPTGPGEQVDDACPARPARVTRDRRKLSEAQIQTALAQGNVVILYSGRPPVALRQLQRDVTGGPFDAEIGAAGQAVILAAAQVSGGYEARAWGRRLTVETPQDPQLGEFTEAWLGAGAPEPCPS